MRVAGIIPARYASSRFDGKALALIEGKTLIRRVYETALSSRRINELIVATDDSRIVREVEGFGGKAVLTSAKHRCGTERVAEAAEGISADIVVNIQGDELLSSGDTIDECVYPLSTDPSLGVSTLAVEIDDERDVANPNVVKVVRALDGSALLFSRSPIPCASFPSTAEVCAETVPKRGDPAGARTSIERVAGAKVRFLRHVGIYAFRRVFLLELVRLGQTPLELAESLEQLRILEHGHKIAVVLTNHFSMGVDVPSDIDKAVAFLSSLNRAAP